jgi:AcrR family transcriptional regulator
MSPRPYRLGQRQAATEQTRSRIIQAARELLMAPGSFSNFSIETVARQADVARMTVYHQFGSKLGLLEALCDSLAASGGMEQLSEAFRRAKPLDALNQYILTFGHFWDVDRLVMRRLRALAALDPDFEQVIQTRDQRRRRGVSVIAQRVFQSGMQQASSPEKSVNTGADMHYPDEQQALPSGPTLDEVVDILFTLTSFETFDTLAGSTHSPEEVAPLVFRLACAALNDMYAQKR